MKFKYALRAVAIELVALAVYAPAVFAGMMRHSSLAPRTSLENISSAAAYILHLPTVLFTYPFDGLVLVTPFTQVVFWTWLLSYIDARRQTGSAARVR